RVETTSAPASRPADHELAASVLTITSQPAEPPLNPIADPKAVITAGHARFTILTPALIRMEWSKNDNFEDRASFAFINRRLDVPQFTLTRAGADLTIKTAELMLHYNSDAGRFAPDNLSIDLTCAGKPVTWKPGT